MGTVFYGGLHGLTVPGGGGEGGDSSLRRRIVYQIHTRTA